MNKPLKGKVIKFWKEITKKTFIGKYYREQYAIENSVKSHFRLYFEGSGGYEDDDFEIKPRVDLPVTKIGITRFDVKKKGKKVTISIDAERVGLLIGKGGRTIDGLKEFLLKILGNIKVEEIKFDLNDSRVWKYKFY